MPRMRTGEAYPLDSRHVVHQFQETREIATGSVRRLIVVDDLPQQMNLAAAGRRRFRRLGDDLGRRPHSLVPPRVGNHAE